MTTVNEFRMHVLILLASAEAKCRVEMALCRSISERRACNAAAEAYEAARKAIEAIVILPREHSCGRSEETSSAVFGRLGT